MAWTKPGLGYILGEFFSQTSLVSLFGGRRAEKVRRIVKDFLIK
jgi:hypothetical protein